MMNDFSTFKEQVKTFNAEKELESEDYSVESLTAGRTTLLYNTQGEQTDGNIQTVIPSMNDDYAEKFEIIKGELLLYASSQLEYDIAVGMGIQVSPYMIVDGVLISSNQNLDLQTTDGVITLPERVEEIGEGAFSGVTGLKEVIIPGTVKVIQDNAFSYNDEIEKVTIKDGVLSIGNYAFCRCSSLKEIIMPDSIVTVGISAFANCNNLVTVQLSNNLTILSTNVFGDCSNLTTIKIPDSIEKIEGSVFGSCRKLNDIKIPAGVTYIYGTAFRGCTNLYNLTIDEANTTYTIEDGIIYAKDNSTLIMLATMAEKEEVTIREGIESLGENALSICTSMKKLNLPSSLNSIKGGDTFNGLTLLETINFPNGNSTYMEEDGYLYSKDEKTLIYVVPTKTEINIKETVETIGGAAIQNKNITELIIPDTVKTLSSSIVSNTTKLKKIEIGSGVSNLNNLFKTWAGVSSGLELIIEESNPYYKVDGNLILTKDGKEVVTWINCEQSQIIPEGVEKLQTYAFYNFSTATEIVLPSTLKEIGNSAFGDCTNLTEIEIPSSVDTIGTSAFQLCSNLVEIRIDKEKGSISGSPWSVPKGEKAIIWLR